MPEYGHLYPLMPLASAFRDAGHLVTFATGPEFVDRLRVLGFEAHPAGASAEWCWREAARSHPELAAGQWRLTAPMLGETMAGRLARELVPLLSALDPDLIVYEASSLGAAVAAGVARIPAACLSAGRAWPAELGHAVEGWLRGVWQAHGAADPLADVWWGDAYIDIWPSSLQDSSVAGRAGRLSMRPRLWSAPDAIVPVWVTRPRARRLVYLSLGTYSCDFDVMRAAVAGLASADVDVLAVVGPRFEPSDLGRVPDTVHVERFVDQAAVLAHVDAAVHHGGSGTALGALTFALPQLLLPYGADQTLNAEVLESMGGGIHVSRGRGTPEAVADAAQSLLSNPSYRAAALQVSRELAAMPEPDEVVPALVALARNR